MRKNRELDRCGRSQDRRKRSGAVAAAFAALLALGACTAGPLYGPTGVSPVTGEPVAGLQALAGRIDISQAPNRTTQIVRNALLFQLNGATPVSEPLYEVVLNVSGSRSNVSIQGGGSGVPSASLYRMEGRYTVRRLSDRQVVGTGRQVSIAPYDRSAQIFAAERAEIDAREKAGAELANRISLTVLPILRREIESGAL